MVILRLKFCLLACCACLLSFFACISEFIMFPKKFDRTAFYHLYNRTNHSIIQTFGQTHVYMPKSFLTNVPKKQILRIQSIPEQILQYLISLKLTIELKFQFEPKEI